MRRLGFLLAVIPFLALAAHAGLHGQPFTWGVSFTSGGTCVPSTGGSPVFCGGTEGRQFAALNAGASNAQLFWANGYWKDTPGGEGAQNAQVLVLNGPENQGNAWEQDVNFGSFCPGDDATCFLATSALQTLTFQHDSGGNAVNVSALVASTWWQGNSSDVSCANPNTPVYVFDKNNSDKLWYSNQLVCDANTGNTGDGIPQVRSFGTHTDQIISSPHVEQYAFAGEAATGIFNGQLSTTRGSGHDIITWNTGTTNAEWLSSAYSGPSCTHQIRPMAFSESTGSDSVLRVYVSACFSIYVRVDGPQGSCNAQQVYIAATTTCEPRWQKYWSSPDGASATSESGLRGLTAVTNGTVLLTGAEGSGPQAFYRIPPLPGCASITNGVVTITNTTCATVEESTLTAIDNATGMTAGNTVAPYNGFSLFYDWTGTGRRIVPQTSYITAATTTAPPNSGWTFEALGGTGSGKKWAEAMFSLRSSNGNYNLIVLPQLFVTPMNGTRDAIASPFPSECQQGSLQEQSCAIYFTGYDADGASEYYWCKTTPCPSSPTFVNTHNTAWVARWGP